MADPNIAHEDSISLSSLKNAAFASLHLFFRLSRFLVVAAIKGIWFMLLGLIIGLGIAFIYASTKTPYYESSMIVDFNKLTKKTYGEILTQLGELAASNSYKQLATELRVDENTAANIISIAAYNLEGADLVTDTSTKVHESFKITARFREPTALKPVETAILSYVNNRPYLKAFSDQQRIINEKSLQLLESDLRKLDTLKTEMNRFLASSKISASVYNNAMNPAEIYEQTINLMYQRDDIMLALSTEKEALSLIDGFKTIDSPKGLTPFSIYTIMGIAGLFIGFLASLFIQTRKKVMTLAG